MPDLRLNVLGTLEIEYTPRPFVEITSLKAQALLVYLAVTTHAHPRQAVAGLLWTDVMEKSARTSLRTVLSQLRRSVGDTVLADRHTVSLNPDRPAEIDVHIFERACRRVLAGELDDAATRASLRTALDLYRGEFLSGFPETDAALFEEWVRQQRQYYHRLALDARQRLADDALSHNIPNAGIEDARQALALDPLHEPAHRALMMLYVASGQRAAALRQYTKCAQLLLEELDVLPSDETIALYDEIQRAGLSSRVGAPADIVFSTRPRPDPSATPRHNLPAQTTPFIGRETELEDLIRHLETPHVRLVTIVGPGGIGKTRLAHEVAMSLLSIYPQGVYFVSLAPLRSAEDLAPAIVEAMELQLQSNEVPTERQLVNYFRQHQDRDRLLLVLDNCEHMLAGAALVNDLLEAGPNVYVVATSRERFHLSGETVVLLGGLECPSLSAETAPEMAELLEHDAVQLFLQSARRVRGDFELTIHDLPHLVRLCDLVKGMPLGILLAATWVELLTLEELVAELGQSLDFLESELRDIPERQQSMRAIFEHSWLMLGEDARKVFMALAIFRGGFSREAGREVAGATLRELANLVNKSLVQREADGRYLLHELLRQYAEEKLVDSGCEDEIRAAHGRYFASFLREREADLKGRRQAAALQEIDADFENVRAAWQWAIARKMVEEIDRALECLYWFCVMRSRLPSGYELLDLAREGLTPADEPHLKRIKGRLLSRAMKGTAGLIGNPDKLRSDVEQALAIAHDFDDQTEIAYSLWSFGLIFMRANESVRAIEILEQSLALFQMLEDRFYQAEVLGDIGRVFRSQTSQVGRDFLQESLNLKREIGNEIGAAVSLHELGWQFYVMGEWFEAERHWQDAYSIQARAGNRQAMAENLTGLCRLALDRGDLDRVVRLAEEISSIAAEIMNVRHQAIPYQYLGAVANARQAYREARKHYERSLAVTRDGDLQMLAELGLAYAASGLDEDQRAVRHLLHAMHVGGSVRFSFVGEIVLLQAALCYIRMGQPERAVALYALAFKDSLVSNTYFGRMPLIGRLRSELEATLPPDQFERAWSEGETLDIMDTLQAVQSGLESISPQS